MAESGLKSSVQELANSTTEPPERYRHKDFVSGAKVEEDGSSSSVPVMDAPLIDIGVLGSSSSPEEQEEELQKLHSALASWGCFMAINHGISSTFLERVQRASKHFFALPVEEKRKWSREGDSTEGYGNDLVLSDEQVLDWTDRLYLTVNPMAKRELKYWPENPQDFREILEEYTEKSKQIAEVVLKAMARCLSLEDDSFSEMVGVKDMYMITRFSYYPPCPKPERVLGLKPHADGSAITILVQDKEVEGLQILKDGTWFRVPIIPDALVINVGDLTQIMSNGVLKSPVHRVVTNPERERITVAMFFAGLAEREIGPVEGLVDETRPRLYKTVKDYTGLFFKYYQIGKRPIDALRI